MMRGRRLVAPALGSAAGIVVALAVVACGGEPSDNPSQGAGPSSFQANARQADCEDWQRANTEQRLSIIGGLRVKAGEEAGENLPQGQPAQLSEDETYDFFQRSCARPFARKFKLYDTYVRAAAFGKLSEALRGD